MEPSTYLEHLRNDGDRLAAVAQEAPKAAVTSCPGWDMTELLTHVGGVHRWVGQIVASKSTTYRKGESEPPEGFDAALGWYKEGLTALLATLGATDPDEQVWNWADRAPAPARFWFRRMAHETAIHRWDAESAADDPHPLAADLAVDGIDEFLGFVGLWLANSPVAGLAGSLHLHATDTAGEWSLQLQPGHLDLRREHVKSDVAMRGSASDLCLWVVNRVPADSTRFQIFGDTEILQTWRELKFT